MLEAYLGPDTFRAGIRGYIEQHKYSNTTTADLWAALGEASGKPVVALAAGWTEQPGFPVVLVSANGDGDARTLKLEQLRFTLSDPQAAPLTWHVPVTLANTAKLDAPVVVLLENSVGTAPWPVGRGTIKANVGDTGYYRVLYDEKLGEALRQTATSLPVADQLNLLSDSWALVENGRYPASRWLDLAQQFRDTTSQPVLDQILGRFGFIGQLQENQPGLQAYRAWVARFLQPQLVRLGWEARAGESTLDTMLRSQLIGTIGACGDKAVLAECQHRFANFLTDPSSLPGDLRGPVFYIVGRYADRPTYERLHQLARAARTTEDQERYYGAMQAALDPALARDTLALNLGTELSSRFFVWNVRAVAGNEHAELAWNFAREHLAVLLKQLTPVQTNGYLAALMGAFTDADRADEFEDFVRKNLSAEAIPETTKAADAIRHVSAVKKRELPAIDAWISAH